MKTLKYFLMLCIVSMFASCKDDDFVKIDSLQVYGERFYKGETVDVGVSVSMSDPDEAEYYWSCDGGQMVHRDGYVVNQWKAPKENGVYTITCKVKCNGASATRQARVIVDGYFFETFGKTSVSMNNSNIKATSTGGVDGRYQGVANSGKTSCYIGKNLPDKCFSPVSAEFDCGIIGNARVNTYKPLYPVDSVAAGFKTTDNPLAIHLQAAAPDAEVTTTYYINAVRVEWWPMAHLRSTQKYKSVDDLSTDIEISRDDFDGMVSFQWYKKANADLGIAQTNGWVKVPFKNAKLKYGADVNHKIGLAVTEDKMVKFYVDGVEEFSWDGLAKFCQTHDDAPFYVSALRHIFPGKTACYVDNMVFYDDGTFGK